VGDGEIHLWVVSIEGASENCGIGSWMDISLRCQSLKLTMLNMEELDHHARNAHADVTNSGTMDLCPRLLVHH
jgi:hypothetical protein